MAAAVVAFGACAIKLDTGASNALEILGYSDDGVHIEEHGMFHDIEGDQNGGQGGVPIEKQFLGEQHFVRATLTKYDPAVVAKITARVKGGTAGTMSTPGTMMSSNSYRLLLAAAGGDRNYLIAIPIDVITHNRGSKAARYSVSFVCYPNSSNVIYNTTNT